MVIEGSITVPEPLEGCLGLATALTLPRGLALGRRSPVIRLCSDAMAVPSTSYTVDSSAAHGMAISAQDKKHGLQGHPCRDQNIT